MFDNAVRDDLAALQAKLAAKRREWAENGGSDMYLDLIAELAEVVAKIAQKQRIGF